MDLVALTIFSLGGFICISLIIGVGIQIYKDCQNK